MSIDQQDLLQIRAGCKASREEAHKKNIVLCKYCDYTGTFIAEDLDTKNTYSFKCPYCLAAAQMGYSDSYPVWKEEYSNRFKIIKQTGS